ncbi:MAG: beta-ketoacyl-ACP synthase II [Myxococcota bacterium]
MTTEPGAQHRRVVVTGLGCLTPNGVDVQTTWDAVCRAESGAAAITRFDTESLPVGIACEVKTEPPLVDVSAKEARRLDRILRFALQASQQAVAHAGLDFEKLDRERVMVAIGSGVGGVETLFANQKILETRGARRVSPFVVPYSIVNMPSGMISVHYGLGGPNLAHSTACASSSHAIGEAMEAIARGTADVALAGGAEAPIVPLSIAGFAAMRALSHNPEAARASRPFDADRDGFVLGEGAAVLVLESEEHARARGAEAMAIVEGYGASADGFHLSAPDQEGRGAVRAMRAALVRAGLDAGAIDAVNAHATATPAGDPVEAHALRTVFGSTPPPISATKSTTGHLLGAAGALEAILSIQSLRDQILPPTANLERVAEGCELDHVTDQARPARVQRVLSNSFGFGGTNGCLILAGPDAPSSGGNP